MVEYGIITTNKFHFLSDDEDADPSNILAKASQIKKVKGTSINKVPQTIAPSSTTLPKPEKQQPEAANKENVTRTNKNNRGARGEGNVSRGARGGERNHPAREGGNREHRGPREGQQNDRPERRSDGERRGRGNTRGEHRGGNADRRPREPRQPREGGEHNFAVEGEERTDIDRRPNRGGRGGRGNFGRTDRLDRTGLGRSAPKKDGHGKGNWGTEQDELKGETEPIAPVETTDVEKPTEDENADKNDSGVEVEKEEEKPVGMTLSEWKEKNKPAETESFNVRKPNDDKKLNLAPLKKEADDDKVDEEYVVLRKEKAREQKVDINVSFATAQRGYDNNDRRGNRGGRGGNRGSGGRGYPERSGPSSRNNRGNQFNLSNEQFPALGGH